MGRHIFLVLMFSILIEVIAGELILYKYIVSISESEAKIVNSPMKFEDGKYHGVLSQWEARDKKFNEATAEKYPSPF